VDLPLLLAPFLGSLMGLVPGIHPLLFNYSSDAFSVAVYAFYTVFSALPTVAVGAFVAGAAFSFVVSHRLASRRGVRYAVVLLLVGIVAGALLSILFFPLRFALAQRPPRLLVFFALILTAALLVIRSERILRSSLVALFSGTLGLLVLGSGGHIVPLVSGLFGVSTALLALLSPSKRLLIGEDPPLSLVSALRGSVAGFLAGILVSVFPAMSVSIASLFVVLLLPLSPEEAVISAGSATSSSLALSVYTLSSGVRRTSLAAALHSGSFSLVLLFASSVFLAAIVFYLLLRRLAPLYSSRWLPLVGILVPLIVVSARFGFSGVVVLAVATVVGVLPNVLGVEKSVLMYSLIVPTLFYYAPV